MACLYSRRCFAATLKGNAVFHRIRFAGAGALALVACLSVGQVALADGTTGSVGNYLFTDASGHVGATCKYTADQNQSNSYWITRITAKPPSVWWPDRNSNSNTEHGKVGWRFIVKYNNGGGFHVETRSSIQKATAYEDSQQPYGSSTKAPFTKMTVSFKGKARTSVAQWRVVVKVFWYRKNGTVQGTATHTVQYYNEHYAGQTGQSPNPYCDGLALAPIN